MPHHPRAGQLAQPDQLINLERLEKAYYGTVPDPTDPQQRVSFGTSGHRGSSLRGSFNENHILAITQAICEYRQLVGTTGPLYIGKDTHALSAPAHRTALEVLTANRVSVRMDRDDGYTPTPVMSHAILTYNRSRRAGLADGIIITQPYVFSKGPVSTQNALRRYGVLEFSDTAWSRGQYTLLIEVQSIDGVQNNVAVNAKVEGRAGDGVSSGEWTPVPSSGLAEDEFLAKLVEMVTGEVVDKPTKVSDQ